MRPAGRPARRAAVAVLAALGAGPFGARDAAGSDDSAARLVEQGLRELRSGDAEAERTGARRLALAGIDGARAAAAALAPAAAPPPSVRERLALVAALASSGASEAEAALVRAAADPTFEVRGLAAQALGGGLSPRAVEALATLARDPVTAVRASALRALFAREDAEATAARIALPADERIALRVRRLALHRLRADRAPGVRALALRAFVYGASDEERLAGLRLALAQREPADGALRRLAILALEGGPGGRRIAATVLPGRRAPFPPAEARRTAVEALVGHLASPLEPGERDLALRLGVRWIANPAVRDEGVADGDARDLLLAALPDLATTDDARRVVADEVAAAVREKRARRRDEAVRLLTGLPDEVALRTLVALVESEPADDEVLSAASGALRDRRRTGGAGPARRLTDPARPEGVRIDGVRALEGEPFEVAGPLLRALVADPSDGVASWAATVLLARAEPAAREALEATLLRGPWRAFHGATLLHGLVERPDDGTWALLGRLLREGSPEAKGAMFDAIAAHDSRLRGPRALALVGAARDEPALGIDVGAIARALVHLDGPASVAFVRAHLDRVTRPGVLLRNLQVVQDPGAAALALEVAARTPDADDRMLSEVATVLSGRSAAPVSTTDPWWRRLLERGSPTMRRVAVRALGKVAHGPFAPLLLPALARADEEPATRVDVLAALARGGEDAPEETLWRIVSNRTEDFDVRLACAAALLPRASDALRERATGWLLDTTDEGGDVVRAIAEVAGRGAPTPRATRLLRGFRGLFEERFAAPPYLRRADSKEARLRAERLPAFATALAAAADPAAQDVLVETLLDPRFARALLEARRTFGIEHPGGGGPLTAVDEPCSLDALLRDPRSPLPGPVRSPLPAEFGEIATALVRIRGVDGARRIRARMRAAAQDGTLAAFDDLYLVWLGRRVDAALSEAGRDPRGGVDTDDGPMPLPLRADGAELADALSRRAEAARRARRFDEAAGLARRALLVAARAGVIDRREGEGPQDDAGPPVTWSVARAEVDLLEGAALAALGRADDAEVAFARGAAREPHDARVLASAARLRLASGGDRTKAADDARRAVDLDRRMRSTVRPAILRALDAATRGG